MIDDLSIKLREIGAIALAIGGLVLIGTFILAIFFGSFRIEANPFLLWLSYIALGFVAVGVACFFLFYLALAVDILVSACQEQKLSMRLTAMSLFFLLLSPPFGIFSTIGIFFPPIGIFFPPVSGLLTIFISLTCLSVAMLLDPFDL
jgi:hypothetical protein